LLYYYDIVIVIVLRTMVLLSKVKMMIPLRAVIAPVCSAWLRPPPTRAVGVLSTCFMNGVQGQICNGSTVYDGGYSGGSRARQSAIPLLFVATLVMPASSAALSSTNCDDTGDTSNPHPHMWIEDMYPALAGMTACSKSTETGFRRVWPRWVDYCLQMKIEPRGESSTSSGLNLFLDEAFGQNFGDNSYQNYNKMYVAGFFSYLKETEGCTSDLLTKSKTFLNSHLRAEYYCKTKKWNPTRAAIHTKLSVGEDKIVSNIAKAVRQTKAKDDKEKMIDLHADIDNRVSDIEYRRMMITALESSLPGTKTYNTCVLYRLTFASTFSEAMSESRRGEELRALELNHLFVRKVKVSARKCLCHVLRNNLCTEISLSFTLPRQLDPMVLSVHSV
jgi:hypothetical protein